MRIELYKLTVYFSIYCRYHSQWSIIPDKTNQNAPKYKAMDFYHVMIKLPDKSELSELTKRERVILKILLQELSIKKLQES